MQALRPIRFDPQLACDVDYLANYFSDWAEKGGTKVFKKSSYDLVESGISLYEKIKLLGGYFTPCAGGFALHVSDKKARLISILPPPL